MPPCQPQEIPLRLHGGGRLLVQGDFGNPQLLLLLSRDQFLLDDELMLRLAAAFSDTDMTVMRYEPEITVMKRRSYRTGQNRLPPCLSRLDQARLLLPYPRGWRYVLPSVRAARNAIGFRCRSLRELCAWLGPKREISIIARSAGGRIATLVADELGLNRVVCLAYPFRHPDQAPDPGRVAHLPALRTPCLILQGRDDCYGGFPAAQDYALGPNTSLEWLPTDHHYALSESAWARLLERMAAFLQTSPSSLNSGQHASGRPGQP